jgi:hypothetical protein
MSVRPQIRLPTTLIVPTVRIVRPKDLVVLELELHNLKLDPGGANLIRAGAGAAFLVLHFQAQHVFEQAFFETALVKGKGFTTKPKEAGKEPSDETKGMAAPVKALLSGRSRLVFSVPDGTPPIPYTLEGILAASSTLALSVAANALPPPKQIPTIVHAVAPQAARVSPAAAFIFQIRAQSRSRTVGFVRAGAAKPALDSQAERLHTSFARLAQKPRPANPSATETAIESPYRVVVSPNSLGRWAHATGPVESPVTKRTELWHTRLGVQAASGVDEEAAYYRAVRAIWTREPGFDPKLGSMLPPHYPLGADPFRAPLDAFDRHAVVHLSSNFGVKRTDGKDWLPKAIEVDRLFLSALGSWMDTRGVWDAPRPAVPDPSSAEPVEINVEEWRQRGTLGRDHYVRVVYAGRLYKLKHPASLIKVTERKFHHGMPGNPAFLRQRMFIVVRKDEMRYTDERMPFRSVRITTVVTPSLDDPATEPSSVLGTQSGFWPHVAGQPFRFHCVATDFDGRESEFSLPLIFVGNDVPLSEYKKIKTAYDGDLDKSGAHLSQVFFGGQKVAYAHSAEPDDTSFHTESLTFTATPGKAFEPQLKSAKLVVPALKHLAGLDDALEVEYPAGYTGPEGTTGELFLQKTATGKALALSFAGQGDRCGGLVQPNMSVTGLSRLAGPVAGTPATVAAGTFQPSEFFGALDKALLFGVIPLGKVIEAVTGELDTPDGLDRSPTFVGQAVNAVEKLLLDLQRLHADLVAGGVAVPAHVKAVINTPSSLAAHLGALPGEITGLASGFSGSALTQGLRRRIEARLMDLNEGLSGPVNAGTVAAHAKGDELPLMTDARFEWRPKITQYPTSNPIFVPPARGLTIAGQVLTQKTTAGGAPRLNVTCLLEDFELHLIAPTTFMILRIKTLELALRDGEKPDVNLVFADPNGIEFAGPLAFVETLRSLIPMDGFSDPPGLDVTTDGIAATYSLALPTVAVGVFSLQNLSLGAGFLIPFVGEQPLNVSFNFCTRENPALLTVTLFGGGGFFGITINPQGVHILEAALEFGACVAIDLGVASGSISAMGGVYLKIEDGEATLTGYFRLRGEVEVLGIVSVSIELYMELSYEFSSGKCVGRATISVEVEIAFVSETVEISCERRFAGSSGDPTFEELVPVDAWGEYCGAFA